MLEQTVWVDHPYNRCRSISHLGGLGSGLRNLDQAFRKVTFESNLHLLSAMGQRPGSGVRGIEVNSSSFSSPPEAWASLWLSALEWVPG